MNPLEVISPIYQVGGSVRDEILGLTPKDFDYATPLLPDGIEAAIKSCGRRTFGTGKRFGTLAYQDKDLGLVEITTFRKEEYTPGSRKPSVTFATTIDQDLSRRDFTINAIAKRDSKYIDPFGGRADIESKTIKAVGSPAERFNEDPLRLLRMCRFAAQLGFTVELATSEAATKRSYKILEVSKERCLVELEKLLVSDNVNYGLRYLQSTGLMKFLLPEVAATYQYDQDSPYHQYTLFDHILGVVVHTPADINLRWSALLHDIGKPAARVKNSKGYSNYIHHEAIGAEMVYGIAKRMKWSEERRKLVTELVRNHASEDSPLREADKLAH